jgi:O-antigen ligase
LPDVTRRDRWRYTMWVVWSIGWAELFLTFSRAALLAAVLGCVAWLGPTLRRQPVRRLTLGLIAIGGIGLGSGLALAGPVLLGRLAPAVGGLTGPAVSERFRLSQIATQLIRASPALGVGAGNFSLTELLPPTNAAMVDPVHNVPLLVAAEAGVLAGVAWSALVCSGPLLALRRHGLDDETTRHRLAVAVAVLTLALLDHYLWTLPAGRSLFWIALGAGMAR